VIKQSITISRQTKHLKSPLMVILYSKCPRVLTFQEFGVRNFVRLVARRRAIFFPQTCLGLAGLFLFCFLAGFPRCFPPLSTCPGLAGLLISVHSIFSVLFPVFFCYIYICQPYIYIYIYWGDIYLQICVCVCVNLCQIYIHIYIYYM